MKYERCYAVISLPAIYSNLQHVRALAGEDSSLVTVVKANGYGHGSVEIAKYTEDITDCFAVAVLSEAIELREAGIRKPILILGYTSPSLYEDLISYDVMTALYNEEEARILSETAVRAGKTAVIHIAVDTGMTRIGFRCNEESAETIKRISGLPGIAIKGMFTHLSCADMEAEWAEEYTKKQLDEFDSLIRMLKERNVEIPFRHAFNSAKTMSFEQRGYQGVRSGIVTYGLYPSDEVDKNVLLLKPALSWYAHVIHIADTEPGRGVSYGATYHTKKECTRIATVSAGYADGYPRALSGKGRVLIRGQYAPIIGRVCMDQFMVDVSDIEGVQVEDTVTLIGRDGENEITADEIAVLDQTINYEVTCRISPRVHRIYEK